MVFKLSKFFFFRWRRDIGKNGEVKNGGSGKKMFFSCYSNSLFSEFSKEEQRTKTEGREKTKKVEICLLFPKSRHWPKLRHITMPMRSPKTRPTPRTRPMARLYLCPGLFPGLSPGLCAGPGPVVCPAPVLGQCVRKNNVEKQTNNWVWKKEPFFARFHLFFFRY